MKGTASAVMQAAPWLTMERNDRTRVCVGWPEEGKLWEHKQFAHLERFKEVFNKNQSLQSVNSQQEHDDGFAHAVVGLLSTETDV